MMRSIVIKAAFVLAPISLSAQWLNIKTTGIPRTPDGKPDLTAPAPHTPDSKPDLSGLWRLAPNAVPVPYILDVIQDIKDEAIFKPEAEALFQKRLAGLGRDWPVTHCLPFGPAETLTGKPYRIIQSPTVVALLFNNEEGDDYRQIFLDGRELPQDPNPTWRGYSVGHWEGDTLVVETTGFNDRSWLDLTGHPHSESLRVVEKFQRVDFGHLQFQVTFNDPEVLNRPLTISEVVNYLPDTDMVEGVCENERDSRHLVGKIDPGVKLSEAVLANYAGTYEMRAGPPRAAPPRPVTIALANGQLYLGALPLTPQSETTFQWFGGSAEFSRDASGAVMNVTLAGTKFDRKR